MTEGFVDLDTFMGYILHPHSISKPSSLADDLRRLRLEQGRDVRSQTNTRQVEPQLRSDESRPVG